MIDDQIEENKRKETIAGLFADVKAADLAARGLIAIGLSEEQVKIKCIARNLHNNVYLLRRAWP